MCEIQLYTLHLFLFILFVSTDGLKIIPERLDLVYCNESHLVECKASMVRYCRRCPYYFNVEGTTLYTWSNNVTVHVLYREYLSNQYQASFVDASYKYCDMLHEDPLLGKLITNAGIECPTLPGIHHLYNLTFPVENFPFVWPFKRGRLDVRIRSTTVENITIAIGHLYATFENKVARTGGPTQAKKKSEN